MSGVCPNGPTHQVWSLEEYWKSRSKDSEAYKRLGPPAIPEIRYGAAAITAGLGVLLMLTGGAGILLGVLIVAAAVGVAVFNRQKVQDALAALEAWEVDYYCVTCPERFSPSMGK
jgi:hypothetical protein